MSQDESFEKFLFDCKSKEKPDESPVNSGTSAGSIPATTPTETIKSTDEVSFEFLVIKCRKVINALPYQGSSFYDEIKDKLAKNGVAFVEAPGPQELSRQIGIIQMMKDELISIFAESHRNFLVRKRIYEVLFDAYMAISQHKSSDKRKGEATLRLSDFSLESVEAEAFYSYCKQILDNLESNHKTVSRRIACMQSQIALGELATAGPEVADIEATKKTIIRDLRQQAKIEDSEPGYV